MLKKWLKRAIDGRGVEGDIDLQNIQYNSMSGGQKNLSVGPALEYLGPATVKAKIVEQGSQIYVLNTTTGILYVSMGDDSVVAGTAPGAGVFPCEPNSVTPYSSADYSHIIGQSGLHFYILRDESKARKE